MTKILVTGGAGYKGVVLTRHLADLGHDVTVLDNFMYGPAGVLPLVPRSNVHFVRKDIRNLEGSDVKGFDIVYHLAGLSGFPACAANPSAAFAINVQATALLVSLLRPEQLLVYASSGSIYGRTLEPMKEDFQPKEFVSYYARTKWDAEEICRRHDRSIVFRWATIFGVSPRMRWELMPNDFARRGLQERVLVLYGSSNHQMLLHLEDCARGYALALDHADQLIGQSWNMGDDSMNPTKLEMANLIADKTGCKVIDSSLSDPDRRDLLVDFSKMKSLGIWSPVVTLEQGVDELIKLFQFYQAVEPYAVI